ncbi:MAG: methyltransferase domain-containing protein [Cytophagales bacterium]|nr:methyltransferase domain-containing protein [Cytophagales bacterium]
MIKSADLRNKFYKNYFINQVSRLGGKDIHKKLNEDHLQLKNEIIPLLPANKNIRILDIGCGYGGLLLLLQQSGYKNTEGIDISEEQVKIAKELGLKNIKQTDMVAYLESNNDKFDVIIGIDIIEHFNKPELISLLEKIKRSLKTKSEIQNQESKVENGGMAIFRTPNTDAPFGSTYYFGDYTHESFLNYSSAEQLFLSLGYQQVRILPSYIRVKGLIKNLIRSFLWFFVVLACKIVLFASGKGTKTVLLTPNLIILAHSV